MIVNSYKHMYKDMNIVSLRSNNIVGTGQFIRNIIPRFSCLGIMGKKMTLHGDGGATRRYLWVGDVVQAFLLLANEKTNKPIYNIGHNNSYSNLEIANKIGAYLELVNFLSFEKDRVYNDTEYPCDYSEIQNDLGWTITKDLDDILPEIIEWYRENIDIFRPLLEN